jgi:hypothetical protein
LRLKTKVDSFSMVWPQNHWDDFFQFGLKTGGDSFFSLASKLVVTVSPGLASKPVMGFLVEPQNQGGGSGFPGWASKPSYDLVILASKLPRQFFGLGLKTK